MLRLKQRTDFLAAANGAKVATAAFVLQDRARNDAGPARIGFTVSRKVGGAVERNRVRRRLRDIVRRTSADALRSGHDYVLIGRRPALSRPFELMTQDFRNALRRLERHPQAGQRVGASLGRERDTGTSGGRDTGQMT
jgi:ribonuclease P protein component